jgi:hypothetical protein
VAAVGSCLPFYLVLVILAGCGGGAVGGTQEVAGSGYTFRAPAGWGVVHRQRSAVASSGPVDLVQVQTFRLVKPYRRELFAAASQELDRVARKLAAQLRGRVVSSEDRHVAGRDARSYRIEYGPLADVITFVLDGRREYQLLCRLDAGDDGAVCRRFADSFALD